MRSMAESRTTRSYRQGQTRSLCDSEVETDIYPRDTGPRRSAGVAKEALVREGTDQAAHAAGQLSSETARRLSSATDSPIVGHWGVETVG